MVRQVTECGRVDLRDSAVAHVVAALLEAAEAPDIVHEGLQVLRELQNSRQAETLRLVRARYPALQLVSGLICCIDVCVRLLTHSFVACMQSDELGEVDKSKAMWAEGHQWLQSAHKDLAEGLRIFR